MWWQLGLLVGGGNPELLRRVKQLLEEPPTPQARAAAGRACQQLRQRVSLEIGDVVEVKESVKDQCVEPGFRVPAERVSRRLTNRPSPDLMRPLAH